MLAAAKPKQTTLKALIKGHTPYPKNSKRANKISKAIAEHVVIDMRAVNTISLPGFMLMMNTIEPRYHPISRTSLLNKYIFPMYHETVAKVKADMKDAPRHAFTTDGWQSIATESYNTMTVHYIDSDFQLQSKVLDTKMSRERHTAENLSKMMAEAVATWEMKDPVSVTDNASNITKACSELPYSHLGCFDHLLNLAVNRCLAVPEVSSPVGRCSTLVSKFKMSANRSDALKAAELQLEIKQLSLIQDVSTRWNSTLDMLERLMLVLPAVAASLYTTNLAHLLPDANQTRGIMDLVVLLKPFKRATEKMGSEKKPTASMILLYLQRLLFEDCHVQPTDSTMIKKAKAAIKQDLQKRYAKPEEQYIMMTATALDPHFKTLAWISEEDRAEAMTYLTAEAMKQAGQSFVPVVVKAEPSENETTAPAATAAQPDPQALLELPELPAIPEINGADEMVNTPAKKRKVDDDADEEDFFTCLFVKHETPAMTMDTKINDELRRYLEEPPIPLKEDSLLWWKTRAAISMHSSYFSTLREGLFLCRANH